jgi:hypothetical protein
MPVSIVQATCPRRLGRFIRSNFVNVVLIRNAKSFREAERELVSTTFGFVNHAIRETDPAA